MRRFIHICWPLSIIVFVWFIFVDNCSYLSIIVLFGFICSHLSMFIQISSYLFMFVNIYLYLLIFVHIYWYLFVFVDWPHSRPITIIAFLYLYPYVLYCIILIFIDFDLCLIDFSSWLCSADRFGLPCDAFHIVFT